MRFKINDSYEPDDHITVESGILGRVIVTARENGARRSDAVIELNADGVKCLRKALKLALKAASERAR